MKDNLTNRALVYQLLRENWDAIDNNIIKTLVLSVKIDLW